MSVAAANLPENCAPDGRPLETVLAPPEPDSTIPARFRYVAASLPDHIAVKDDVQSLTYAELDAASDRVAHLLVARLGVAPEPVALLLPNRVAIAVGILGVLKAGKFYAPVDPRVETAVRQTILAECGARVLLTVTQLLPDALAHALPALDIVAIDALDSEPIVVEFTPQINPRAYALLMFTSGTTGVPKGVLADQSNILFRALQAYRYDKIRPDDRVGQLVSPTFALFASVFFTSLLNGATLVFYAGFRAEMAGLLEWVAASGITVFYAPVSLLRDLLTAPGQLPRLPAVRTVLIGGQGFVSRDLLGLRYLVEPECTVVNRLSMSEVYLLARYEIAPDEFRDTADPIPVGAVCEGHEVLLLDEDGAAAAPGEIGQIVVRSEQLSPGYWKNPELTAAKYRPDPAGNGKRLFYTGDLGRFRPDGVLEHCGRLDFMVKIRGYRVEPEAIAAAIKEHPDVVECVVVAIADAAHDPRLVAYYASRITPGPSTTELRAMLAQTLPAYMTPARFVSMARLPRNANGKIDRTALPAPDRARPELQTPYAAPRTDLETRIAELWAEDLELETVGVDDDYFALGGDSLSALRMILHVERFTGRRAPPEFFNQPTVAHLAQLVSAHIDPADTQLHAGGEAGRPTAAEIPDPPASTTPAHEGGVQRHAKQLLAGEIGGKRALRGIAQRVALQLPYFDALRWLRWWSRQPAVANRIYADEQALFYRFVTDIGAPDQDREALFSASLLANCIGQCMSTVVAKQATYIPDRLVAWSHSRYRFAQTLAKEAQSRVGGDVGSLLEIQGLEHLVQARARGQGLILLGYHGAVSYITTTLLSLYADTGQIAVISATKAMLEARRQSMADDEVMWRWSAVKASQLLDASLKISDGGVVLVPIDGLSSDQQGVDQDIYGYQHRMTRGLANLAQTTGAPILPLFSTVDQAGRLRIALLPAFQPPALTAGEREWLASLADLSGQFLRSSWRAAPESLSWGAIRRHYLLPHVEAPGKQGGY